MVDVSGSGNGSGPIWFVKDLGSRYGINQIWSSVACIDGSEGYKRV